MELHSLETSALLKWLWVVIPAIMKYQISLFRLQTEMKIPRNYCSYKDGVLELIIHIESRKEPN